MSQGEPPRTHRQVATAFVHRISGLPLHINEDHIVEDLLALQMALPDVWSFEVALERVCEELATLALRPTGTPLRGRLGGWLKRRFSSGPGDAQAVMRLVFRKHPDGVELLAFGDRFRPRDFYDHAKARLRP